MAVEVLVLLFDGEGMQIRLRFVFLDERLSSYQITKLKNDFTVDSKNKFLGPLRFARHPLRHLLEAKIKQFPLQ